MSQGRQSKWQTSVDLDTGGYLRKGQWGFFALHDYLTHSVTSSPAALPSLGLTIPSLWEVPPGPGRSLGNWVGSLFAVAHPYPSQLFPLKVPRHSSFLVFLELTNIQDLPSLPGSLLQQRSLLFQDHLLSKTSFYRNPFLCKSFPNPVLPFSPFQESMLKHNLLISGFILCFFINLRIWGRPV